jgi:hypothetical protein
VAWEVTARTRGYISIGFADTYNVMSPADVYAAWLGADGAAVLSHRRNDYGYDAPSLQAMTATATVQSASFSAAAGMLTTAFTTPLPAALARRRLLADAAPVNFIWGVADAVPSGRDGELITHLSRVDVDFGAALLDLLCVGDGCVLAAPQEPLFTTLHKIAASGAGATLGAATLAHAASRRWFLLERVARATIAGMPLLPRRCPPCVASLGTPDLLLTAGYVITFALYLRQACLMYPASPGHALGTLLAPMFATALLPVTRNSAWVPLLGVSFERAVAFHRTASTAALALVVAHTVAIVNERGVAVLASRLETR